MLHNFTQFLLLFWKNKFILFFHFVFSPLLNFHNFLIAVVLILLILIHFVKAECRQNNWTLIVSSFQIIFLLFKITGLTENSEVELGRKVHLNPAQEITGMGSFPFFHGLFVFCPYFPWEVSSMTCIQRQNCCILQKTFLVSIMPIKSQNMCS